MTVDERPSLIGVLHEIPARGSPGPAVTDDVPPDLAGFPGTVVGLNVLESHDEGGSRT
jgi:hypothetical protein